MTSQVLGVEVSSFLRLSPERLLYLLILLLLLFSR